MVLFRCGLAVVLAVGLAGQQAPRRSTDWPCLTGRAVDPSYAAVAEGSGGHLYMMDPAEIGQSGTLMAWHQKHTETVFRAMGELSQPGREFVVPVDSVTDSLVITISLQCKQSVSILDPSGAVAVGDQVEFRAGKALRVYRPSPGIWKVRIAGSGLYFVTAEAVSDLSLDEVRFVEPGGRPGHEGLFRTKRAPVLGSSAMLWLDLAGAEESVRVRLIDSGGDTLDASDTQRLAPGSYVAHIVLRHSVFRILVEGRDRQGWPFQRLHEPLTVIEAAAHVEP